MLKPLNGKAILILNKQDKTESGIVITNNLESSSIEASVYAVSEFYDKEGRIANNQIGKSDIVIISKFSGNKIEYKKEEYLIVDIDNILAKVEEDM